jgi:hypothetical protein
MTQRCYDLEGNGKVWIYIGVPGFIRWKGDNQDACNFGSIYDCHNHAKMYVMLGIPFSLLYIIKSSHVYEPKFWRFDEKFWKVLADYSQKHPVTNNPGIDDLPACY